MATYDTGTASGDFTFQITYWKTAEGWVIDSLSVLKDNEISQKDCLFKGVYPTESVALAYGVRRCEDMVNNLNTALPAKPHPFLESR